jgi:hypothetical protein
MKNIFILTLTLLSIKIYGQTNQINPLNGRVENQKIDLQYQEALIDSVPKIIIKINDEKQLLPLYFLNGQPVEMLAIKTINPDQIKKIWIEKDTVNLYGSQYYGKILISTKSNYHVNLISLNKLKTKYTKTSNKPTVFLIDNEFIDEDYDKLLIDENYILKIEVSDFYNSKEKLNFTLIKLFTRSKGNLDKKNTIYIRDGVGTK